ncbi:MAG TPA: glycosyltransferase [Phycisphaerae bacterium]|nr:glycosyltransferase [Phycisphaerae bacterium]HOJ75860.1 glycosyltransferase [Phycisphaerae bacterium]HOM53293.1 glycosyltransferase [Phycisphaerae bacterium]HON68125.1 glycosyltransferase [Phycisphaerae bacterium]HOQ85560.1 glycosyltransferase [Phycisphaerae bacterium]
MTASAVHDKACSRVEEEPLAVTVAICTHRRPEALLTCVRSVLSQTRLPDELIVVDDGDLGAEDRETLSSMCAGAGVPFIYLQKSIPGLPASRNLAVAHARGDIVQFLDDDVGLDADFLRQILRLYHRDATGTLVGVDGTLCDAVVTPAARAFALLYKLAGWWSLGPRCVRRGPLAPELRDRRWAVPVASLSGACMSFRRWALLAEPFDEALSGYALGEDRDISLRLGRTGWLLRSRAARATHHHDPAGRPDAFQFGRATVLNHVRIMRRIGRTGLGDTLVIAYSLTLITAALALCSLLKPRRYARELHGLLCGAAEVLRLRPEA